MSETLLLKLLIDAWIYRLERELELLAKLCDDEALCGLRDLSEELNLASKMFEDALGRQELIDRQD